MIRMGLYCELRSTGKGFDLPDMHGHTRGRHSSLMRIQWGNFMQLIAATRNRHKLEEIREILSDLDVEILDLDAFPDVPPVEEDGLTFEANAIKKARETTLATGKWTMADDSGLEVDALGGDPGVHSARYAGEPVDYEANNRKLLKALEGVSGRKARFRCVIAICSPEGNIMTVNGTCEGHISERCTGTAGFGYDPLFVPDGHSLTFAELGQEVKNGISHRSVALENARSLLSATGKEQTSAEV